MLTLMGFKNYTDCHVFLPHNPIQSFQGCCYRVETGSKYRLCIKQFLKQFDTVNKMAGALLESIKRFKVKHWMFSAYLFQRFVGVDKCCTFVKPLQQKYPYCVYSDLHCKIQLKRDSTRMVKNWVPLSTNFILWNVMPFYSPLLVLVCWRGA